ncbi:tripartite motif-containing protein 7-like [Mizuhopecten yessoensis]|uniref:Tripartite motif-containing protein 59 n=1 Tax=Mizuhopecten yessoensis TaxID=6573 RepID=A0A210PJU4_MIZYE|nr:tripartite motif-containing protein 7-like [Mizuhopecten yessoensis]OWF36757.1 Tripartite motif-containing protein 59 [Mizuhopecten yessoensis]
MATAIIETAEDQITCTICFEIFEEPKALPCLHTFCRECIKRFITEKKIQTGDRKGYVCPICRRHVSVPANVRNNPEVWADQLENNHVVSTMIDAYKTPRRKTTETCADHPEKELEFFCADHAQFICSLCFLKHRRCADVITREEARSNINKTKKMSSSNSTKANCVKQHMDLLFEQCNSIEHLIDKRRNTLESLSKSEQLVRDDIISMRKRINELLNKHEEKALTRLAKIKTKNYAKLEKDKRKLEKCLEKSQLSLERIQKMVDKKQNIDDNFIDAVQSEYKSTKLMIEEAEKKNTQEMIAFIMNPVIKNFVAKFDCFGKLHIQEDAAKAKNTKEKSAEETEDATRKRTQASDQSLIQSHKENPVQEVKLRFQGKPSWITGIAILPSGKLLLIDHTNEAVSVFSISLDFLCKTNIHPAPYDVASISSTQDHVMMSIPDTRELMKCDVLQDGFVEVDRKLKTNIACKAVASDEEHVAVCSSSDLQLFETDGEVWMNTLEESYARTKFTYLTLISSKKKVFITDQTYPDPHIRCLDFDGTTLWKVAEGRIGFCTGICVTGSQLMVTSWDSGKIFTLSLNGDDLKTYNDCDVSFPWNLHVSSRQKIVCVSQHKNTLSEEDKRTIKILHIA